MNKHNHETHTCNCEHERVQFCKRCQVVHCLDCGKEWQHAPCTLNHYPPSWTWTGNGTTYELPTVYCGTTASPSTTWRKGEALCGTGGTCSHAVQP